MSSAPKPSQNPSAGHESVRELSRFLRVLTGRIHDLGNLTSELPSVASLQNKEVAKIASSMQLLSQDASRVADAAGVVLSAADAGRAASAKGLEDMRELNQSMAVIKDGCLRLAALTDAIAGVKDTLHTLDDIVRRTRLLSFNASIEAARAGENAKSFSVIAEEVRRLAQNSQEAAGEINAVVQKSVVEAEEITRLIRQRVGDGASAVEQCSQSFDALSRTVNEVAPLAHLIADVAGSQRDAVRATRGTLDRLGIISTNNVNLVRQMDDLSAGLREETGRLGKALKGFAAGDAELRGEVDEDLKYAEIVREVGKRAARAQDLNDALQGAVDQICGNTLWGVAHVLTPRAGSDVLVSARLWHVREAGSIKVFMDATERAEFAPGVGLPGRVYKSREPAWILDVTKDVNFPRAPFAEKAGLHAGFAFPIIDRGGEILGVVEFFSKERIAPDQRMMEALGQIGLLLGQVQARQQTFRRIHDAAG